MRKTTRIYIEVAGIACTIWGIISFIKNEKTVYVITLCIILLTIFFLLLKDLLFQSISYLHIKTHYKIIDETGARVLQEVTKTFRVNAGNITTIFHPGYAATGEIKFISTSLGEVLPPIKEGASTTMVTFFPVPLKRGAEYSQVLKAEFIDSFLDSKESVSINVTRKYKTVHLIIEFPEKRLCKNARAFLFIGENGEEISKPESFDSGKKIEVYIERPVYQARYAIQVEW